MGPTPGLRAETLIADRFAPVVSPGLAVRTTDDLRQVPAIDFDWQRVDPVNPTWERWFAAAGLPMIAFASRLRFSDEGHAIQAAIAGQGAALLSLVLVRDEIEAGQLVQPFGPILDSYAYHLIGAADRPDSAPARIAKDWVIVEARPELALGSYRAASTGFAPPNQCPRSG
jgi:LysR family transcriptional regulator, glycine cleavage system transcriptional activator